MVLQRAVRDGRDTELDARGPERVVVVLAVEPEHVEPVTVTPDGTARVPGDEHGLEAELTDRVAQLLDRLRGRVHRDERADGAPVLVRREHARVVAVDGTAQREI